MIDRFRHLCHAFAAHRAGSTATIFALAAIPTIAAVGLAIDYGTALASKTKLDAAADAASMVAITTAKTVIAGSASSGPSVTAAAIAQGQSQALSAFKANAGSIGLTTIPVPTVQIVRAGQKLSATVSYKTQAKTSLMTVLGIQTVTLSGLSSSTLTMPTYINYYIITDISQSMGVGATPTDMQNLYNRVIAYGNYDTAANKNAGIGCVFGCHVQQSGGSYKQPDTNENLAHNTSKYGTPYINLRIDAAKSAINAVLSDATAANQQAQQNLIQIGIYTMQQDPTKSGSTIQTVVSPPNANFTATTAAVTSNIDLGANTGAGIGDTGFSNSLNYFVTNILTQQGDGSSSASPLNYVFLITDGISDLPGSCTDGHCTAAFDPSACAAIKGKASVGVIYTTYNPIFYKNDSTQGYVDTYNSLVAPYIANVPGNLQSCASSASLYFEASDGPAITTGMQKLFAPTAAQARLSQ